MSLLNPLQFYLINFPGETVFTGRVNGTPVDPYINIPYDTGVTGSFGDPIEGQSIWFGSTSGGQERGVLRLRTFPGGAAGTITVAESDDIGPQIQNNDFIRIVNEFRLWPKYPRFVQNGEIVTIFEDYDIAYTNQLSQWRPKAVAGPPGVAFLSGGTATISFVGDRSQANAPGSTITNYLWTARQSSEGTSTSQGTEGSPVVFTWTSPGRYLVTLQVTDSNGQTDTQHTWAIVENPDNRAVSFVDFDTVSDSYDFNQGGGEVSLVIRETDAGITDFPEESMIILVARGDITTPTGSWPFRTNVMFVGWILANTVRQNPETGDVSFRAATIDAIMKNVTMFPVSLTDTASPVNWTQALSLTVDRAAFFLYTYRSTLGLMSPIVFSGYTQLIRRQDFGPTDLYSQVQNELMRSVHGAGRVVATHQGVIYHEIDHNIKRTAERASVTTRKLLHKGVWVNDVAIEETHDYSQPTNQVKMSGIHYPGGQVDDICPVFSEAPGDAPKVYGKESNFDRLIVVSSADLNARSGLMLAKLTERYPIYRMQFVNDGSFITAPQELFPANIESADNDRELSFTGNLIPRRISRQYNHNGGYFTVSIDFEPETTGPPGITVDMPCGPPEQVLPEANPDPPAALPGLTALIAGTTGSSFYFEPGLQQNWQRRVTGLLDPSQIGFLDILPDPWSNFKQGYNPDRVIVWGSGRGFMVRTEDSGNEWTSRAEYLEPAPNWPGESDTALSELDLIKLQADIFSEDRLYVLARWQETGAYHGAVAKSEDGFAYTWHNITGSSQVRPLGMSVDRGNGLSMYITTWEADTTGIHLRRYDTSDMSLDANVKLADATSAEIDANTYYATPFNRNGQANELFIFGNLLTPQGFTGTVQVMQNTAQGATGSYSVIENTWGSTLAGSFGADEDDIYYAVRNSAATSLTEALGLAIETPVQLVAANVVRPKAVSIDGEDIMVAWANGTDNEMEGVVVDASASPLSVGSIQNIVSITSTGFDAIIYLGGNRIFASYILGASTDAVIISRSGNTLTANTPDSTETTGQSDVALAANANNSIVWMGREAPTLPRMAGIGISGTTVDFQFANEYNHSPGWVDLFAMRRITGDDYLLMYDRGGTLRFQVMTASSASSTPTWGTEFDTSLTMTPFAWMQNMEENCLTVLSNTLAVALYAEDLATDELRAIAISISGQTISAAGTPVTLTNAGTRIGSVTRTGDNGFVAFWGHSATPDILRVESFSVAGTVITANGDSATATGTVDWAGGIITTTDGEVVMVYGDDATNVYAAKTTGVPFEQSFARFYQSDTTPLTERFTLPFAAVQPAAFTLDQSLGTVVIGSNAPASPPIVFSEFPYITGTTTSQNFPTGTAVMALKWI